MGRTLHRPVHRALDADETAPPSFPEPDRPLPGPKHDAIGWLVIKSAPLQLGSATEAIAMVMADRQCDIAGPQNLEQISSTAELASFSPSTKFKNKKSLEARFSAGTGCRELMADLWLSGFHAQCTP